MNMLTRGGYIKKTELAAFSNIREWVNCYFLEEGDQLRWVRRARAEDSIIIGSRYGMAFTLELTMSNCVPWVEPHAGESDETARWRRTDRHGYLA